MKYITLRSVVFVAVAVVGISFLTVPATAQDSGVVTISEEYDYDGTDTDREYEQMVGTTVTVESDVDLGNVEIEIQQQEDTLIDFETLRSPNPLVTRDGNTFTISELTSDEQVNILFEAYPKTQSSNVTIAVVDVNSDQTDPSPELLRFDMANSPLQQLQDAQERISTLQTQMDELNASHEERIEERNQTIEDKNDRIDSLEQWQTLGPGLSAAGVIIAVVALAGAFVWQRKKVESTLIDRHESLSTAYEQIRTNKREPAEVIRREIKEISDKLDSEYEPPERPGNGDKNGGDGSPGETSIEDILDE